MGVGHAPQLLLIKICKAGSFEIIGRLKSMKSRREGERESDRQRRRENEEGREKKIEEGNKDVSGAHAGIDRMREENQLRGITGKRLPAAHVLVHGGNLCAGQTR